MSTASVVQQRETWVPSSVWLLVAIIAVACAAVMQTGFSHMVDTWTGSEEYSHALMIPFISVFLLWQRADRLAQQKPAGSWWGVVLAAVGALLQTAGMLGALEVVEQYGLLFMIYGLVLALIGFRGVRIIWAPLLILAFMIPLPDFVLKNLSSDLQLLSSQIGVWFIRLFDISVFLEGNVIDLGSYKLQVAEACDGLRYLFPLMTLGFIAAYMFNVATWKRVVLFFSTIPITVLMNSFRIGTIGVMVDRWGVSMAEGFLHDFQGWVVFMVSVALLVAEMMLLSRIGTDKRPWREVFGVDVPGTWPRMSAPGRLPNPFVAGAFGAAVFAAVVFLTPERAYAAPARETFVSFPTQFDEWTGRRSAIDRIYLDALKLDDYINADFVRSQREGVNFYVAWYNSQEPGRSAHSPRSCLPGGGWRITALSQIDIPGAQAAGGVLRTNRAQIELGNQKQLVYYWFQQRGRIITNEYLVKWYLFWDSLTRGRSDGALVRLVTPVRTGESFEAADRRLAEFSAEVATRLERFVPN